MIRKLRLKFVAICMALVTAVLAVVFLSVYFTMERSIETLSRQVLYRVAQDSVYSGSRDFVRPEIGIDVGGDRVLLPYFTVEVWGSQAYVTGGTYDELENTEALQAILTDCGRSRRAPSAATACGICGRTTACTRRSPSWTCPWR